MNDWFGHILTAAFSLASVVYSYATLKSNHNALRREYDKHLSEEEKYVLKAVFDVFEHALDDRYNEILRRLDRIEGKLNGKVY